MVAVLVMGAVVIGSTTDGPITESARVQHLTETIRCPVCNGLAVADSPSSTARAIAADVRRLVADGKSDAEIVDIYVDRYGTWILLEPPTSGLAVMAWLLPIGFVAGAAGLLTVTLRQRLHGETGDLKPGDRRRVEAARRAVGSVGDGRST